MNKLRIALSVLAIVIATFAAYSFSRPVPAKAISNVKDSFIWIKYNCSLSNPVVTMVQSGNNWSVAQSGLPDGINCNGTLSICARKYLLSETTGSNNRFPITGATVQGTIKCTNTTP
ncbi:MAG: hypothetical protein ABI415_06435 [Flavitalea sp.]